MAGAVRTRGGRALLLSGGGRYADPWHPFAETSAHLASVLRGCGLEVEVREDVDAACAELLEPAARPRLLVVNAGAPQDGAPVPLPGDPAGGLAAHLGGGHPLLGVHACASSFADLPAWEERLGGRWVPGTSMHPEHGLARVRVLAGAHPVVAGAGDFELLDERYAHLRTGRDVTVLADHEHEGRRHPLLWAREVAGARTVYDALGHDARSYASGEHRQLLARAVRWLVAGAAAGDGAA